MRDPRQAILDAISSSVCFCLFLGHKYKWHRTGVTIFEGSCQRCGRYKFVRRTPKWS